MTGIEAIAVVGATATGKTHLAETLARELDAEVVCADSRQVFVELEVGTGRPLPAERAAHPHHLFAALHLGQHASAGWYARAAGEACDGIRRRGRLPLLVGGSGFYLRALREGLATMPPHDPSVRERLRAEVEAHGTESLHARLAIVDPESAARLAPHDRQRVCRALEVYVATGRSLSWWHARMPPRAARPLWRVIELVVEPVELRRRIARRTTWMFDHGLIEETRALLASGHGEALGTVRAIGYDEATELIAGRLDRAAAEASVNWRTAQLARRQRTWFRHQIEAARLDGTDGGQETLARAAHAALRLSGLPGR